MAHRLAVHVPFVFLYAAVLCNWSVLLVMENFWLHCRNKFHCFDVCLVENNFVGLTFMRCHCRYLITECCSYDSLSSPFEWRMQSRRFYYFHLLMFWLSLWWHCHYSRTPDERPPSPTTIPLIRPHFVWWTVVSVRIRIPHERPSLLYDHTNVILRVVV